MKKSFIFKLYLFCFVLLIGLVSSGCDNPLSSDNNDSSDSETSIYTVTFDSKNATTPADPTSKTVKSPTKTVDELPTPPEKTGFNFDGWFTEEGGGGNEFTASTTVTDDITVFAKWIADTYTVTFDSKNADTEADPTSKTVTPPATTIDELPTAPEKAGYIFDGWYTEENGGGTEFTASTTVTDDITVFASWTTYQLTVITSGDGHGSVSTSSGFYPIGETVTLNATADAGSTFAGWTGASTSYNKQISITMDSDKTVDAKFTHNDWTIMIYLDSDNDLESFGMMDMNEMEASNLYGSGVNVIALVDRVPGYYTGAGDWTNTRLYQLKYDENGMNDTIISDRLSSTELGITVNGNEELNMGDPNTGINFIEYCKNSHPADNYAFVVWNHGTGWRSASTGTSRTLEPNNDGDLEINNIYSEIKNSLNTQGNFKAAAVDETSNDILFTQEIGDMLDGQGIDVVGFDTCLGAMIEVGYEIKDHANFMVASEETEPGGGWQYTDVLDTFKVSDLSATALVDSIVDAYEREYTGTVGATLSGIELSEIDNVMSAFNDFSDALYNSITNSTTQTEIANELYLNAEDFYNVPGDLNIDIADAATKILTNTNYADTEASELITAVNNAVYSEWHDISTTPDYSNNVNANGLAVHFIPLDSEGSPTAHNTAYVKNTSSVVQYPLAFVQNSQWVVDNSDYTGLLYRLWYESF